MFTPQTKKGFTIIETLIAIFILITAVLVPLTIASKGILYSNIIRDQSTASYLAQEAIEYIRQQRDNQALVVNGGGSWANLISQFTQCTAGKFCTIDTITGSIQQCAGALCPALNQDLASVITAPTAYAYGYDGSWTPTKFTRTINIDNDTTLANHEAKVTVTMSWLTNGVARQFTIYEYISNWQK